MAVTLSLPTVALVFTGLLHLVPLRGLRGAGALSALYGVEPPDAATLLLLRHRAVLFGLLGVGLLGAVPYPAVHRVALGGGLVSVVAFLALMQTPMAHGPALARVYYADVVALVLLVAALVSGALG